MWGQHRDPNKQLNAEMIPALAGYEVRPKKPVKPAVTSPIERQNLDYEIALRHLAGDDLATGYVAYALPDVQKGPQTIKDSLADTATHTRQSDLLQALGFDPATAVDLSETLEETFVLAPPMVAAAA